MSILFLAIGVVLLLFIAYMLLKEASWLFTPKSRPAASTGYKPSIKAVDPSRKEEFQVTYKGTGKHVTEAAFFETAIYRLQYQFPTETNVKVDLVSADGKSAKTIVNKSGFGSSTFNIQMSKYYAFQIEPADDEAEWALVIRAF